MSAVIRTPEGHQRAGLVAQIADLEAANARLRGLACLICGRDTLCELDTNGANDPNWPGSPCTFDPSPIDAARRFMQERDEVRAANAYLQTQLEEAQEKLDVATRAFKQAKIQWRRDVADLHIKIRGYEWQLAAIREWRAGKRTKGGMAELDRILSAEAQI